MTGIVILNYNTWDETLNCINSIETNTTIDYQIYVVDNCSPVKPTREQIKSIEEDSKVVLIFNDMNNGYAAGNNVGLKRAVEDGCEDFLIANSDIVFVDDTISKLKEFGAQDKSIAVVGPLVYSPSGRLAPIYMLCKLTAFGKLENMLLGSPLKKLAERFEKKFIRKEIIVEPLKVWGVHGCCFYITSRGYKEVFPFDEHTFLYEEEYILGCRMEQKRLSAYVIPNTYVIHAHGKSTGGITKFSYKCLVDSEQYYLKEYINANCFSRLSLRLIRLIIWKIKYKG